MDVIESDRDSLLLELFNVFTNLRKKKKEKNAFNLKSYVLFEKKIHL